ncbi:MAG: hypothetical protein RL291_1833, partial [Pseudomonadota bacterium]
ALEPIKQRGSSAQQSAAFTLRVVKVRDAVGTLLAPMNVSVTAKPGCDAGPIVEPSAQPLQLQASP